MKIRTIPLQAALLTLAFLTPVLTIARQGTPPLSRAVKVKALTAIPQLVVPPTDAAAELAADARSLQKSPKRFAVPANVLANPLTHGAWETVRGGRLWRLRVASAGATDLNLGFTTCWLPDGATLHIYSEDEDYFQGPYSERDNKAHGQLWTPVVPGGRAVIELFVPADAKEEPRLVLSQINCGYRDMFHRRKDLQLEKDAGGCNIDVICPQGDPWRNEIRSVATYSINGFLACSGTLINNASNNFRNFFLTAAHCGINSGNASTIVVYWNFEAPTCGLRSGGSLAQNQSGAILRMSKNDVDVTLIELDDIPDSSFRVYYAGWDRSGSIPTGVVGIHHPNVDEKSISFANAAPTTVDSCIGAGANTHWQVIWTSGVTEPGSSGSGIWDPVTHRLIGTLSGGFSACDLPFGPDCYGKFSVAWDSGNNSGTRLRDWLDPGNTMVMSVPGTDPSPMPLLLGAGTTLISQSCQPTNSVLDPGETVTIGFALRNFGASNTLNLVATLLATNGVTMPSAPQNYGVVSTGGSIVTRQFTFIATGACGNLVTARLQLQDGTNNLGILSFPFRLGTAVPTLSQNFDGGAPSLPVGWVNTAANSPGWYATNAFAHTAPNSVFAIDRDTVSDSMLTSPAIPIVNTNAQLLFSHYLDTEDGFDGGVLEVSYNGGPFVDIITAGGSFVTGGYNSIIPTEYQSPIAEREAWSGKSGGFLNTLVNLPVTAAAQSVRLRWRFATDESVGFPTHTGWYVDTVSILDGYVCCSGLVAPQIIETRRTNGAIVFSFNTVAGITYITEFKNGLGSNFVWTPLKTNAGDGTKKSVTNSTSATPTNRFFRVRAQ
jgi:hypothetical protein